MRFKTKLIILLFTPIRWIIIQFNKLSSYYYAEVTNKKFRKEANLAGEAWLQMPTFLIGTKYMYIGRSFLVSLEHVLNVSTNMGAKSSHLN